MSDANNQEVDKRNKEVDKQHEELDYEFDATELIPYVRDATPLMEKRQDREGWRLRRLQTLREMLHGPMLWEDALLAREEELELRYGPEDEHFGR